MKIKHYAVFNDSATIQMQGKSLCQNNWDILRLDNVSSPFTFEETISDFNKNCEMQSLYKEFATIIKDILHKYSISKITSFGVGKGILEWHIKNIMPEIYLECTDYAEKSIDRLKQFFPTANNIYRFDMLSGDYNQFSHDTCLLFFRVSTEFSTSEWRVIFEKMSQSKIENIIFIPTELLSLRIMLREKINYCKYRLSNKKMFFCGNLYSKREYIKIFHGNSGSDYKIVKMFPIGETTVFYLKLM